MATKVLAVDDQAQIVRLVQINLERHGYEVVTASDGEEALEQIRREKPDLIIADVLMPRMDGFQLLREIRSAPETRDLPFIMMTVKSHVMDINQAWEEGVDCFLTKPFDPTELLHFVRQVLETSAKSHNEEAASAPLSLSDASDVPSPAPDET